MHSPTIEPKGKLQMWYRFCHDAESCHSKAITLKYTADAPKNTRPQDPDFIQPSTPCRTPDT